MSCQNGFCSMRKRKCNQTQYSSSNSYNNYNNEHYNNYNNYNSYNPRPSSSLSCPKSVPMVGDRPAGPMGYYVANSKPSDTYFSLRDPPDMNFWRRFG